MKDIREGGTVSERTSKEKLVEKLLDTSDGYELVDFKFSLPIEKNDLNYDHNHTEDMR